MKPLLPHSSRLLAILLSFLPNAVAQSLSGRVVDPTGQPIAGIVVDAGGGTNAATTGANGSFTIAGLQNDDYDVEYLPPIGAPWAARAITHVVAGATTVGDIVLQPGFVVSGTARNQAGAPLFGCNVNVYQDGQKLFTPHDGSDLAGNFAVVAPAGVSEIRVLPPVGAPLVPFLTEGVVVGGSAGNLTLGNVTLRNGLSVTGTVVDAVSSVPIGSSRIKALDSVTGQRILLVNDTVTAFGQFNILLPSGLVDLEISPPVGNSHVGRLLNGVVVAGPLVLGTIGLKSGVLVTGMVAGPAGSVIGADIDVLDAEGVKQFTAHDFTGAGGTFSIAVPAGSGWRFRFEPPVSLGLVGLLTSPLTLTGNISLGTLSLAAGLPFSGTVRGPDGTEVGAHLRFFDQAGNEVVTVGDRTDGSGRCHTFVPPGHYALTVETVEGSPALPVTKRLKVAAATQHKFSLPSKVVRCELDGLGTPTITQGGVLSVGLVLQSLTAAVQPTIVDLVVESSSGNVYTVLPPMPLDAPPVSLVVGLPVALPLLPASEVGKELRLAVRFRDPVTAALLDRATTPFVLQ